ncbi:hypothetical protein NL676_027271 [Syzygium grande]|nr:hypothetical protein NL676_027271 [Syzygium grande]
MCLVLFSCNALVATALDTITTNQSVRDGESLLSAGGTFELGFFSAGDPQKRYLGIWYKKITTMTIVWVANRVAPLADASSTLRVTSRGSLVLLDGMGSEIWSSNLPIPARNFTYQIDPNGYPQLLLKQGSDIKFRSGPWNGLRWSGTPNLNPNPYYREYNNYGQDLYIRMAASESGLLPSHQKKHKLVIGLAISFGSVFLCLVLTICILQYKKKMELAEGKKGSLESGDNYESQKEDLELPLFDLSTVAIATNNFSTDNKLGEGGFGPVYKGVLKSGQEIAVKKLSRNSRQGLHEFKNEVIYVSKLQHRNLVKLLGCCIQEENILIYEFMPNRSLDSFLFDPTQREQLDWSARFNIIIGIARGLLYLHQDSRLRIIHRDVKASNVLLDYEMNPKISDFGLAKSFAGNETKANTNRVVGTYGYMSPEYALDGVFSTKSDVFSYGVLVLEIVSGLRNRGFQHPDHYHNLLGHAWILFTEGRSMRLLDKLVENSCSSFEALRSIHIGLLCVQRCPDDRPSMSAVVMMLGSDIELPLPKEPGFFNERDLLQENTSHSQPNEITMTMLSAR